MKLLWELQNKFWHIILSYKIFVHRTLTDRLTLKTIHEYSITIIQLNSYKYNRSLIQ